MTPLPAASVPASGAWLRAAAVVTALVLIAAAGWWTCRASVSAMPAAAQTQDAGTAGGADAVQQALRLGKPTVVEFGSTSCVSCREMKPLLAQLAREHGERVAVTDLDILKERSYIARYHIRLMPTQVFYDAQGRETSRHLGKITVPEMLARLGQASPPGEAPQ
jgi:thioredoxin 1